MRLDTTHDCWHGPYSSFGHWRAKICEIAGFGNINDREGFGGVIPWPSPEAEPIVILLDHSDCDGEIRWQDCNDIADALESLMPSLKRADADPHNQYFIRSFSGAAQDWIDGLRLAASKKENVLFK